MNGITWTSCQKSTVFGQGFNLSLCKVSVCVCVCVCVCVLVKRERETETERERETEKVIGKSMFQDQEEENIWFPVVNYCDILKGVWLLICVCVCERERGREIVCVCVSLMKAKLQSSNFNENLCFEIKLIFFDNCKNLTKIIHFLRKSFFKKFE